MTEEKKRACAITGHRILEKNFDGEKTKKEIRRLIEEENVSVFYCGMALGFDMYVCEYLQKIRSEYPQIKVIACIPCPEQADKFPYSEKRRYERLVSDCDEKKVLSSHYTNGCMFKRNRYMVDNAAFLLAHCIKETGGSAYTVSYAREKGVAVQLV